MQNINALSLTSGVNEWLSSTRHPRILHVFDNACNLINERKEMLSIVTPQIGNGPFNLVVETDILFSDYLGIESPASISPTQPTLGDLTIKTSDAKLWNPRPDWEILRAKRDDVVRQAQGIAYSSGTMSSQRASTLLTMTDLTNSQLPNSLASNLSSALANSDITSAQMLTSQLAGLGVGLTPAGDDFIMGALHAVWIIHPLEFASVLAKEIADTAAPLTTSLSAAWLRSAGRGDAGQVWHEFFNALIADNNSNIQLRIDNILAVGETSGADAMAGFLGTMQSYIAPFLRKEETSSEE